MPKDASRRTSEREIRSKAMRCTRAMLAVAGWLAVALPAAPQINFGRIVGRVSDPSGAAITAASITVTNVQTAASQVLTTGSDGGYVAPALPPGTYSVRAEASGFKTGEYKDVVVQVGEDTRVDVALQIGAASQRVVVTESVPLVDTSNATVGGTLSNEAINDLPLNGRNFQNLITLRPGVMIQPGGGAWTQSTNGGRAGATIYYVDGLMDNDYNVGWTVVNAPTPTTEAGSILPIDAIQEFNLEQNPKAEFGWKSGSVVNVGIKSGTNSFHGSAYAFGRDSAWDARNYFNPIGQPKLPLQLENFGGTVGGPIFKDRLFFFAGYEGRRDLIGNSFGISIPQTTPQTPPNPSTSVPDAAAALKAAGVPVSAVSLQLLGLYPPNPTNSVNESLGFPNTDQSDNGIAKIEYRISDHHTLDGLLFVSDYFGVGEDRAYANSKFLSVIPMHDWVNNYSWIWTPNPHWVNEVRFGFNRMTQDIVNGDSNVPATSYGINTGITHPGGLPTIQIGPFTELGTSFTRPAFNGPSPLYDGLDNVTYVHGKHTFKFGFELARIHAQAAGYAFGRGQIQFLGAGIPATVYPAFLCPPPAPSGSSCSTPLEDFLAGYAAFPALVLQGNPTRHLAQWSYGGFFQDDWRLTPRLTLNLGLRYEYFSPPTEQNNLIGNFSPTVGLEQVGKQISRVFAPDRTNFSPRLGIAWDPTGNGKTAIRAGGGILYDHVFLGDFFGQLATQDGAATGIGTIPTGFLLSSDGVNFVPGPGTIASGVIASSVGPAQWNGQVFSSATPSCAPFAPCGVLGVVPNFKYPYIAYWNVGVQHSFTSTLGLDVNYIGNTGQREITITNINQPTPTAGTPVGQFAAAFPYLAGSPAFGTVGFINQLSNIGWSNYNGLQVTLTQHTSHGLSFLAGYTYSHALDLTSLDAFAIMPQDSQHPARDYASSDFDVRNRFTLTTTYALPGRKSPLQMLEGWQINSLITIQSGQPWIIDDTTHNFSNTFDFTDRWDFFGNPGDFTSGPKAIPYCSANATGPSGFEDPGGVTCLQYENNQLNATPIPLSASETSAAQATCLADAPSVSTLDKAGCYVKGKSVMVPPAFGTFGTMRRNIFRDSGFRGWDFSVFKTWRFGERVSGQFRAEFFNILNHPNFANPYGGPNGFGTSGPWNPGAPGLFGCGCATPDVAAGNPVIGSGDARAVQFGLKILF
jgi:carboxypeptidase family protein/TonB-dependent receptor-like protein